MIGGSAARLTAARTAATSIFAEAGYTPVEPPLFSSAELFLERLGERFRRLSCFFEDGAGTELCLRPEITIPVCLMALEAGYDGRQPLRLRYEGPVFRLADDGLGPVMQSSQAGAEFFGDGSIQADAEIITLASRAVRACGIAPDRIMMSHAGAFHDLVLGLGLPAAQEAHLFNLFEAYGSGLSNHLTMTETGRASGGDEPAAISSGQIEATLTSRGLTLTGGRSTGDVAARLAERTAQAHVRSIPAHAIAAVTRFVSLRAPLHEAADQLSAFFQSCDVNSHVPEQLRQLCAALGDKAAMCVFDASIHAPLGYYTGLEFRIEAGAYSVAGGGRYDRLFTDLAARPGLAIPAIGCAVFLDTVAEALS